MEPPTQRRDEGVGAYSKLSKARERKPCKREKECERARRKEERECVEFG